MKQFTIIYTVKSFRCIKKHTVNIIIVACWPLIVNSTSINTPCRPILHDLHSKLVYNITIVLYLSRSYIAVFIYHIGRQMQILKFIYLCTISIILYSYYMNLHSACDVPNLARGIILALSDAIYRPTWTGDRQGRPSAVNLCPFVDVDLNRWPTVYIAVIELTRT